MNARIARRKAHQCFLKTQAIDGRWIQALTELAHVFHRLIKRSQSLLHGGICVRTREEQPGARQ